MSSAGAITISWSGSIAGSSSSTYGPARASRRAVAAMICRSASGSRAPTWHRRRRPERCVGGRRQELPAVRDALEWHGVAVHAYATVRPGRRRPQGRGGAGAEPCLGGRTQLRSRDRLHWDGSYPVQITSTIARGAPTDQAPAWSPDGSRIVFASTRGESTYSEIYVVNADGRDLQRLTTTPEEDLDPAWSPDGQTHIRKRVYATLSADAHAPRRQPVGLVKPEL